METAPTIPDLKIAESKAATLYEKIAEMKITDLESCKLMSDVLREVKKVVNVLSDRFKPALSQAYQSHKEIKALQDQALERFQEAEKLAKDKLAHFYKSADQDFPKMEGISLSEVWKGKVTELSLIPREYMVPDLAKLEGVSRVLKQETRIPGWQVYSDISVRVRD